MAFDVAVVGGGPAGLSAAIQARQRGKTVVVLGGDDRDGALYKTQRIDNYLGFPQSSGAELLRQFRSHAEEMGVQRRHGKVLSILPMGGHFYVSVDSDVEEAGAVVLAVGVARAAKFPGEEKHLGRGVSYCATCDGMLYRDRDIVVYGRCAEAPAEAAFLRGIGCRVTYVAPRRPEELDADIPFVAADRVAILGEEKVVGVKAGEREIPCQGVFLLRATLAPTDLLPALALQEGYIQVDRNMATNIPGVFAAGDCTGGPLQVSKAVGEGQIAGHRAAEYVDQFQDKKG